MTDSIPSARGMELGLDPDKGAILYSLAFPPPHQVLYDNGFPVPRPVDHNRHCVIMGLIAGYPLYALKLLMEPSMDEKSHL